MAILLLSTYKMMCNLKVRGKLPRSHSHHDGTILTDCEWTPSEIWNFGFVSHCTAATTVKLEWDSI